MESKSEESREKTTELSIPAKELPTVEINAENQQEISSCSNIKYLTTDISSNTLSGFFGCVEEFTSEGIRGWVLNAENLKDPVAVNVMLEGEIIGTAYTVIFRADVSKLLGRPANCGFLIKWQRIQLPAWVKYRKDEEQAKLEFNIDSTSLYLRSLMPAPTFKQIREWVGSGETLALPGSQKKVIINSYEGQHVEQDVSGDVKAIAFYLPQFHPIPENDEWWGPGFTEWTNVVQAKPLFPGHYQPHVSADLGYYDLRLPEVREAQAELAKKYGIYGFCYYYYWFAGRRILERPLQEVLESGKPDFPFCICWANESWSRRWDGSEHEILLKQEHTFENDVKFIHDVIPILRDPRYIRVNGKPILLVYRLSMFPAPSETAALWRKICRNEGLGEIYLCAVESFGYYNPIKDGFDAAVEFPPHGVKATKVNALVENLPEDFAGDIYDYQEVVFNELNREVPPYKGFRGVMCGWDNTPRRKKAGNIFLNATPEAYELWLRGVVDYTRKHLPAGERFVFINAWNEWAEGAHLEPDRKFGHAFLEATRRALGRHTDWRVLLELAEKKNSFTQDEVRKLVAELRNHLTSYEQSLRYLTRIHKPLLRDMLNRAIFVSEGQISMVNKLLSLGGEGSIDQVDTFHVAYGLTNPVLDRNQCVWFSGWAIAKGHHPNEHTIDYFKLIRVSDNKKYYALAKARYKRKDIVLTKTEYSKAETTFSGFRTFLDFTYVEPGEYHIGIIFVGEKVNTLTYFNERLNIV